MCQAEIPLVDLSYYLYVSRQGKIAQSGIKCKTSCGRWAEQLIGVYKKGSANTLVIIQ